MNGSGFDWTLRGLRLWTPQRDGRRLMRHMVEGGAHGRVLTPPALDQRGVFGVLKQMVLDLTPLFGVEFSIHQRVKVGFLDHLTTRK